MFLRVIFCLSSVTVALDTHIVGVPSLGISHGLVYLKIGHELVKRGHRYTIVLPTWQNSELRKSDAYKIITSERLQVKTYKTPFDSSHLEAAMRQEIEGLSNADESLELWRTTCECLLNSTDLFQSLGEVHLFVCDIGGLCCPLLADLLNVSRVDLSPAGFIDPFLSFIHNFPSPISNVPQLNFPLPRKLSFFQRLQNTLLYIAGYFFYKFFLLPPFKELWEANVKESRFASVQELFRSTGLLIIPTDFALEGPRPLGSHVKVVGPILPEPAKPLPRDLHDFITEGNQNDVVLVSFGTVISNFNSEFSETIGSGLAKLPVKVVWKYRGDLPQSFSANIKTFSWVPQNDLLGHSKVKVFLTHGGLNSILEAAYHGTPVVIIPLYGDQYANARKVEEAEIGVTLNHLQLRPFHITDAVSEVLSNPKYYINAKRISKLMQQRRQTPTEVACDWIEYGLYNDVAVHLRPKDDDMIFFQTYLFDVALFVTIILFGLFILFYFCLKFCCISVIKKCKEKLKTE